MPRNRHANRTRHGAAALRPLEPRLLFDGAGNQAPTLTEMAIIAGATGIALAMPHTPTEGDVWHDITRLVGELAAMHDSLCAPPAREKIHLAYTDIGFTVWDGVQLLTRRQPDALCIFAVNT